MYTFKPGHLILILVSNHSSIGFTLMYGECYFHSVSNVLTLEAINSFKFQLLNWYLVAY